VAADIEHAVSAFARSPNSGMFTAVSAAALEHKDLIIKPATQFRLPVVYAYRVFVAHGAVGFPDLRRCPLLRRGWEQSDVTTTFSRAYVT